MWRKLASYRSSHHHPRRPPPVISRLDSKRMAGKTAMYPLPQSLRRRLKACITSSADSDDLTLIRVGMQER